MNICDQCKNYYPNNHYCQFWDCDVTIQHETCCGFANMTNADRIRTMSDEELAKHIYETQKEFCRMLYKKLGFEDELNFSEDYSDILAWLNAPQEESEKALEGNNE